MLAPFPPLISPVVDLKSGIATPHWNHYFSAVAKIVAAAEEAIADLPGGLPTDMAFLNVEQAWTALQNFNGGITVNGFPITVTGPVTLPQTFTLPPNVAFLDVAQTWTALQTFGASLAITPSTFTVNGHTVTVTAPTTLPGSLPANVAFTNVSNAWTAGQTLPGLTITPATFGVGGFAVTVTGNVTLPQGLPPNIAFLNVAQTFTALQTFTNDAFVFTNLVVGRTSPGPALTGLNVGNSTTRPQAQPYPGITVQYAGNASQLSLHSVGDTEGGMFAYPGNMYIGSWTNHSLFFRVNNLDVGYFSAFDRNLYLTNTLNVGLAYFYVGGHQITVTGPATLPAALPPFAAFLNVVQSWTALQNFDTGLTATTIDASTDIDTPLYRASGIAGITADYANYEFGTNRRYLLVFHIRGGIICGITNNGTV